MTQTVPPVTSYSQQKTILRCPKRYEYYYIQKLRPKTADDKFLFGRAVHHFLETYYQAQVNDEHTQDEAFELAYQSFQEYIQNNFPDSDETHEQANLAEGVIKHYFQWSKENDNFKVLGTEIEFQVPFEKFVFTGRFDVLVEINGKYWIMEHKTASQLSTRHTLMDKQITTYIMAAREKGVPVEGVIYNTLKKAVPEKPKILKNGKLSTALNQNITYSTYMEAINELGHDPSAYQEVLEKLRARENPFFSREYVTRTEEALLEAKKDIIRTELIKSSLEELNLFPRNETRDCSWDCPFFDLCLTELEGGDTREVLENYVFAN